MKRMITTYFLLISIAAITSASALPYGASGLPYGASGLPYSQPVNPYGR